MTRPKRLPLLEEARMRVLADQTAAYAAQRAARHPWMTISAAAFELGVNESRISQLIRDGVLSTKPNVTSRRVAAVDVYNYTPRPLKRKAS